MQVVALDEELNSPIVGAAPTASTAEAASDSQTCTQCSQNLLEISLGQTFQEPIQDPVVTADGNSYERSAIEAWLVSDSPNSPLSNKPLPHVTTNFLRDLVECMPEVEREKLRYIDSGNLTHSSESLANGREQDMAPPVAYGGNFSWVGAPYRLILGKGGPLRVLNLLTSYSLGIENMVFTADGGFQRPGESTPLFPQQGMDLRWRWDAQLNRVIIDFFSEGNLLPWRWDELQLSRELRFPSTVPDFQCIGHVGRFTFDYAFRSAVEAVEAEPLKRPHLSRRFPFLGKLRCFGELDADADPTTSPCR
jgi:hypothetical protein